MPRTEAKEKDSHSPELGQKWCAREALSGLGQARPRRSPRYGPGAAVRSYCAADECGLAHGGRASGERSLHGKSRAFNVGQHCRSNGSGCTCEQAALLLQPQRILDEKTTECPFKTSEHILKTSVVHGKLHW